MSQGLSEIAAYLSQDVGQLRNISQNIANVDTTGYRAQSQVLRFGSLVGSGSAGNVLGIPIVQSFTSNRQGSLRQTRRSLDVALSGSGYLAVQTPRGVRYTRAGHLHLSADGTLVDPNGYPVLGVGGTITLQSSDVTIAADGSISEAGRTVGRLGIFDLADPAMASSAGHGLYRYTGNAQPDSMTRVVQGNLEMSNVNPAEEMVNLIRLNRQIGTLQRTFAAYDQVLGMGINQIGK